MEREREGRMNEAVIGANLSEPHSSIACDKISVSAFRIYIMLHSNYSN